MPKVTATPRGQSNGKQVTEFLDTINTTATTYTFPTTQERLKVKNNGYGSLQLTVNGSVVTVMTVLPSESKEFYGSIDSFVISSSGGVQSFEVVATASDPSFLEPRVSQLEAVKILYPKMSFLNAAAATSRLRRAENRAILTHFDGAGRVNSVSAGVTYTQTSAKELIINIPGASTYSVTLVPSRPIDPLPNQYIDYIVESLDWSVVTSIQIRITPDNAAAANYYYKSTTIPDPLYPANTGILVRSHEDEFAVNGTPTSFGLTANGRINFQITTSAAATIKLWSGIFSTKPIVPTMIMFDDWNQGVYDYAFPAMKRRGITGTFFAATDLIGVAGNITWDELHEMQEAGWTIGNHTKTHVDLVAATLSDAIDTVEGGAAALAERGFRGGNFLAAPFNSLDSTRIPYLSHVVNAHRIGMAGSGLASIGNVLSKRGASNGHALRGHSVVNTDTPQGLFDLKYLPAKTKQLMFCFVFHVIDPVGAATSQYEYTIDLFNQFLDLLVDDGATFVTLEEYAKAYVTTVEDVPGLLRY